MTDAELARGVLARTVRRAREAVGLSQRAFAERYRINPRRLEGLEQGRFAPDSALMAYLRVIEREHEAVDRAGRGVNRPTPCATRRRHTG